MTAKAAHGDFGDVLTAAGKDLKPVCASLRRTLAALHPGFVEVVWVRQRIASYGIGPRKMSEHYAYIGVQRSHVNLGFYHGASLRDPGRLLEGTGKRLRHVKLRTVAEASRAAVVTLLRQARAERERKARP